MRFTRFFGGLLGVLFFAGLLYRDASRGQWSIFVVNVVIIGGLVWYLYRIDSRRSRRKRQGDADKLGKPACGHLVAWRWVAGLSGSGGVAVVGSSSPADGAVYAVGELESVDCVAGDVEETAVEQVVAPDAETDEVVEVGGPAE